MIDEQSTAARTEELGRLLKEGRASKGWTLRQAAVETGISNGYLSLIEQGEVKSPSPRYLMALADKYELSFERLMTLAGHPSGASPGPSGERAELSTFKKSSVAGASVGGSVVREGFVESDAGALEGVFGADISDSEVPRAHPESISYRDIQAQSPEAAERRQLAALVMADMRALTVADIAQVRAFIAGLRSARRA
jgi:transcriptional regulator with XRE-family HTH domain